MFYLQNVRRHDKREYIGIYRQMLRVIDKGVTTAQMAQAARNYAESEFVKAIPDLRRHHIRRFFVAEHIRRWGAASREPAAAPARGARLPCMLHLGRRWRSSFPAEAHTDR